MVRLGMTIPILAASVVCFLSIDGQADATPAGNTLAKFLATATSKAKVVDDEVSLGQRAGTVKRTTKVVYKKVSSAKKKRKTSTSSTKKATSKSVSSTKKATSTTTSTSSKKTSTTSPSSTSKKTSSTSTTSTKSSTATAATTKSTSTTSTKSTSTLAAAKASPTEAWTNVGSFAGSNFFEGWNFFSDEDPTEGIVDYQPRSAAFAKGLAYVNSAGQAVVAVDSTHDLANNTNRPSVRLHSKKAYSDGLVVWDIAAAPYGCGVWPALWSYGPNWPNGGEFDVVEGVGDTPTNRITLHTLEGCTVTRTPKEKSFTATMDRTNCYVYDTPDAGCSAYEGTATNPEFGSGWTRNGGGVWVSRFDSTGLYVWTFPKGTIPADITAGKPQPDTWTKPPTVFFSPDSCDYSKFFGNQTLIINITLGGGWAGATYGEDEQADCPGTIYSAVMNATNFVNAHWIINSVNVYQQLK